MASLKKPKKLAHLDANDKNLVIRHRTSSTIVVSHERCRVVVYQVDDLKIVQSWSTKYGHEILNGAIYNESTGLYAALVTDKVVRQWKHEDSSIEKGSKTSLSKPAFCLVNTTSGETLVVYQDSSVSWLSETVDQPSLTTSVHFCIYTYHGDCLYIAVCTADNVYIHKFLPSLRSSNTRVLSLPQGVMESSTCFHCQGDSLLLVTASNGKLMSVSVTDEESPWTQLQSPDCTLQCVTSLGSSFLALADMTINGQDGLGIWDVKYNLLRCFTPYPDNHTACQMLYRCGQRLIMVCSQDMYVSRFNIESSSLAMALGTMLHIQPVLQPQNQPPSSKLQDLLCSLTDTSKTLTRKQAGDGLNTLAKLLGNASHEEFLQVMSQVCLVLTRCADDKNLWSAEPAVQVIKAKPLPARLCGSMFERVISSDDLHTTHTCIKHMEDIPENIIAKSLSCYLRNDDNKFSNLAEEIPPSLGTDSDLPVKCPFSYGKAASINILLNLPYNDIFMQECLRDMELNLVLSLLQYLYFILASASLMASSHQNHLSLTKVIEWLNMVIDAHFSQLVLSVEARTLLVNLHQTVDSQVELLGELVSLDSILNQIKDKCRLPSKQLPGLYNIHTLHIL